jgi:hypothetical protein
MPGPDTALELEALAARVDVLRVGLQCDHAAIGRWQDDVLEPVLSVGAPPDDASAPRAVASIDVDGGVWGTLELARDAGADAIDPVLAQWAGGCMAEAVMSLPPRPSPARAPRRYELRVRGHLSPALAASFEPLSARFEDGHTVLRGIVHDDAVLYGHVLHAQRVGLGLIGLIPVVGTV